MNTTMAKRRTFSITMTDELRDALDQMVESRRFKGRSHAIEYYLKRGMELEKQEREFLERRERDLSRIWEKDTEKIKYLLDFFEAVERNPELMERLREAVQELSAR